MQSLEHMFEQWVGWVYTCCVESNLYALGLMGFAEYGFDATAFFCAGVLQIIALCVLVLPMEKWRPVEPKQSLAMRREDMLYTLINQLGILPLAAFLMLWLWFRPLEAWLRQAGFVSGNLEHWWPWLHQHGLFSLLLYVLVIDFAEYWRHRFQHWFHWWWALHAVHHAQTQMSLWTDSRNHLVDELIAAFWLALLALLIGVPPAEFPIVLFFGKLIEALSHANLRSNFSFLGYLIVSPQFHRVHHAMHENVKGGNYAVLFSFWDRLFHTHLARNDYPRTGIADQSEGRNYGKGWWQQQILGIKRMLNPHA
jgi:sterol desaturase/sphingolipid hydroxylase (fatty acid hydroxylase superfamily)